MRELIVSGCLAAVCIAAAAQRTVAEGAPVQASPMPPERAQATFADVRVKTFMNLVTSNGVAGKCSIPDPNKTQARLLPTTPQRPGVPPDFSSSLYEIEIPCPGNNGLSAVRILAEFVPMRADPLNLTLSLLYRQ
jgi:hypothetical protein